MVNPTDRLELNRYGAGDSNWSHSDTVETVDELAIERGAIANRPTSGNYDDELYLATDQQILYRWDETATDWIVEGVGSETDPLPKIWANEIDAESVSTGTVSGDVVGRAEVIDNLEGNQYLEPEGTDPGTVLQNDGDIVFIHE